MTGDDFKRFREKYFPGKTSYEEFAVVFGMKYHTIRRYDGVNPNPVPLFLQKSMGFFEEKEQLKQKYKRKKK